MTDFLNIVSDLTKYFAGVVSVILVEFLRKLLFQRPKIKISFNVLIFGPSDPQNILTFSAVNMNDIPVIFESSPLLFISYQHQIIWSDDYPLTRVDTYKYPVKLLQHDSYNCSFHILLCIRSFLRERLEAYNDSSPIDVSKLRFQVYFIDTTTKQWKSRKVKIPKVEVGNIEEKLRKPIYDPRKARSSKKAIAKRIPTSKKRPVK